MVKPSVIKALSWVLTIAAIVLFSLTLDLSGWDQLWVGVAIILVYIAAGLRAKAIYKEQRRQDIQDILRGLKDEI